MGVALQAQLSDDFSDGDFTGNPEWFGNTDKFTVNNGELQLNDLSPGSNNISWLYLPAATSLDDSTTWECNVRMAFATSASNYSRLYLAASSQDFNGPQNGYYLRVGGISGSSDAVELFRQDGTTSTLILSGVAGGVGGDPVTARIRVTRSTSGVWTLWTDYSGGNNFQQEASASDATYPSGQYFGVVCYYTSTRSQSFFFDDIRIDPLFSDDVAPVLSGVQTPASNRLLVSYNEPLDPASYSNPANFQISGIGVAIAAMPVAGDPASVELELPSPMVNLQAYTLTSTLVADLAGNVSGTQNFDFTYYNIQTPTSGDVIISEIMADPTPAVGLPEAEYVELYNRSNKVIRLSDLKFGPGTTQLNLPNYLLFPGAYVVLCDEDFAAGFAALGLGPVVTLPSFPSLTNTGAKLSLFSQSGIVIFEVSYTDDWYADLLKMNGGWSLEMVRLDDPGIENCPGNWRASQSNSGGSPGQVNSLQGMALEQEPPVLLRAFTESAGELTLVFSEPLNPQSAETIANYSIDNGLTIINASLQTPDRVEVLLTLSGDLQPGTVYTVTARSGQKDCIGNSSIEDESVQLGLAEAVSPGDVVVNEVLFYPESGGVDFVELYNRSEKIFNISGWDIVNEQKETGTRQMTIASDYLLFPGAYVALSASPGYISSHYTVVAPAALLENTLPTLDSDAGNVTIRVQGVMIDSFDYDDDLHNVLLSDKRGVSIERISPDLPTQDRGNWHSAAASAGFATPTALNSQFSTQPAPGTEFITLVNTTFSPDGDGYEDVLTFTYALDKPGYAMSVRIFDAAGREVRNLIKNQLLAREGIVKWDGSADDGSRARVGIYVLWAELIHPDGTVERLKKPCVVAGKF